MIFYTSDGNMILRSSRNADILGVLDTKNKDECLKKMKVVFRNRNKIH